MKHQKHRREQFTEGPVSATLPASAIAGHAGSVLLSDEHASSLSGDVAINMDNIGPSQFQHQMQLIDEQVRFQLKYDILYLQGGKKQ